jgi:16S rRNA (adenine1518-N6/adenine1519-N6)-dimethyltransferase
MNPVKLGQHFLVNKNIAKKIVHILLPVKGPILEIGPGKGILTRLLVSHDRKKELVAIEKDKKLFNELNAELQQKLKLINADILDIQLNRLFPQKTVNLIGNIPYLISKKIINWIIREHNSIKKGVFLMQKEFVEKLLPLGDSPDNNPQMIMFEFLFNSCKEFEVRPGSFSPPPKVVSVVFSFRKRKSLNPNIQLPAFYLFLKKCFSNRRKTLLNNLSLHYGKKTITRIFAKQKLNPRLRTQQLSLADFISLYRWLNQEKVFHSNPTTG